MKETSEIVLIMWLYLKGTYFPYLSLYSFVPLFFGAPLNAVPEVKTWGWVVYLGSDSRQQEWESRENETGKEESQGKGVLLRLLLRAVGLFLPGSQKKLIGSFPELCTGNNWRLAHLPTCSCPIYVEASSEAINFQVFLGCICRQENYSVGDTLGRSLSLR